MIKRIPAWLGLLVLLPAMAAQAPAREQDAGQAAERAEERSELAQTHDRDGEPGPRIYPGVAANLIEKGAPVIDVRSDEEVAETGMLGGAVHIEHTKIDEIIDFIGDDTSRAVILYCGSGRRAGLAIENLGERGYQGMVNAGGFEDLRAALDGDDESGDEEG